MAFFAAVDAADWPAVEKLIADDFTAVVPPDGLMTRAEYLADLRVSGAAINAYLDGQRPPLQPADRAGACRRCLHGAPC